jgi:cytochrome d ubiquinol oxidase subunit I
MEATFFAIMFFGWNKVSKGTHLFATWMTGIGAGISAIWILVANSWMQHPVGMEFNPDTVRHEMVDFWALVLNPVAIVKFFHSVTSGWMTGAIFVIGISSWYLIKKREVRFALASIRVASIVGIIGTLLLMWSGDGSAIHVAEYQPMKLAAAEGLERGGAGAPFSVVPGVEIPKLLSILATHDAEGVVPGIEELKAEGEEKMAKGKVALDAFKQYRQLKDTDPAQAAEARKVLEENVDYFGYGYIESADELVPNVPLVYWSFRVMVGLGGFLLALMVLVLWAERKGKMTKWTWLQHVALWSIPLVYLAGQAGWIVAEVGRQPWVIEGLLPTKAAVSSVSVGAVQTTFFLFVAIFTLFLAIEIRILLKAIQKGPEVN